VASDLALSVSAPAPVADEERMHALLNDVVAAIDQGEHATLRTLLHDLHPAETAQILESLPSRQRDVLWDQIHASAHAGVLAEAEDVVRAERMEKLEPHQLAAFAQDIELDDAVDMLQDLPDDVVSDVLDAMDAQNRARLELILGYDEDSAGGLMNTDVITIRPEVSLGVVVRYLRRMGAIPEKTNRLMVIDRDNRLIGVLRLALLITEHQDDPVSDHMETRFPGIPVTASEHEVAQIFERRDLISAAVVDEQGRLLGRITVDDVMDVIREEGERSLMATAGLDEEDDAFERAIISARRRTPWLAANLATALLAAWVIGLFEAALQHVVALAIMMPVVASMGGIAGSQTLTVVIRGIALGQIGSSNARWLMIKELAVGAFNGLLWALVVAGVAIFWFGDTTLGLIAGTAIVINLVAAAAAGASIPLILRRLQIDPALAGSVILTTVTDVVGFVTFLGLGTLFLLP
jgi:magnesium transporter